MIFLCKNDKKCVRIAYRSETNEKEVKMGKVGPLLGVPCT